MGAFEDFFTKGDVGGGNNISDPFKQFEGTLNDIKKGIDEATDFIEHFDVKLNELLLPILKRIIWDPIDEQLIQPFTRFIDDFMMYLNCSLTKIENFWGCFIWYVIYIVQETLNILILGHIYVVKQITGTDLKEIYLKILDIYGYVSDIVYDYIGLELLIFPFSDDINARCFVCKVDNKESKLKVLTQEFKDDIKYGTKQITDITHGLADDFVSQIS
jgi:hypothetical protein